MTTATPRASKAPQSIPATPLHVEIDLTLTEAAWKKYEPRARALAAKEVHTARVDVTQAAAIAIAAAENVLGQRDRLVALFREPELDVIERIHEVALAAQHADLLHRAAQDESAPFADILSRMNELRGLILDDMGIQVRRKRIPARVLDGIRDGDNKVRDKANDLNDAATYYRAHWSELAQHTTVSAEEVAEASRLATVALARMGSVLVARTARAEEMSSGELRRRAFTLLERDYDVARRYGAFLFWGLADGWEAYVPSLWSGRPVAPTAEDEAEAPEAPSEPAKPA